MAMAIRFKFNARKTEQILAWLAQSCPEPTKHKIAKILYFADKEHLNKYGRPITGDMYAAMQFGPVPSSILNMLNGEHPKADGEEYPFCLDGRTLVLRENVSVDTDLLSESDLEEIEAAVEKYGSMGFRQLTDISHNELSWEKASHWMDFSDFIHDDQDKSSKVESLEELAELIVI